MKKIFDELKLVLNKSLNEVFGLHKQRNLIREKKEDQSIVTEIDLLVSNYLKEKLTAIEQLKKFHFFSEEDFYQLEFPAIILDPIDGTNELSKGIGECAVSLAIMHTSEISDPKNFGWIYNPFTTFSIDSSDVHVMLNHFEKPILSGAVSSSEYAKGLYDSVLCSKNIRIFPRGSIAFKLGLLSAGACDFVISKRPKNIWDIAAGTLICSLNGINFYVDGVKQSELKKEKYEGLLIWAKDSDINKILNEFK
jgi:myo-inositol-1(or 4)-monophosphatase